MSSSLKKSGSTTQWRKIRSLVIQRDGSMCVICGDDQDLTVDHIHERQHGGGDQLDNLQTLCHRCHKAKTAQKGQKGQFRSNRTKNGQNDLNGGFFVGGRTPPTPPVLLSPQKGQNGHHRTGSDSALTESVSHG